MDRSFIEDVSKRSGQCFDGCFHCLSCAGGCPVVDAMDHNPNQIIRMVQFGMRQKVLESNAIWLCIGCFNCISQCPNRVNIPAMMDTLREMALEEGVKVPEPGILAFHRAFLAQVKKRGRVFELGLMMRYKLSAGNLFQDAGAGSKLMSKGRFKLLPKGVNGWRRLRQPIWRKQP
jgi:heterodisulfide reductase subunit C